MIELKLISGGSYLVTDLEVEALQSTFPAVDVKQELREMANWLEANPSNRKTDKGIKRFMHNWLGKAQDRAPRVEGSQASQLPEADPETDGKIDWLLSGCKSRGLVPEGWEPKGDTPKERYGSVRAKATLGFYRENPGDNRDAHHQTPPGPLWGDDPRPDPRPAPELGQILLRTAQSYFQAPAGDDVLPTGDRSPESPAEPLPAIPGFTTAGKIAQGEFESILEAP